jgi:putative FmdB family regulatory protein
MPLYEYQCTECGVRFERHQHFDDTPVAVCPECGGEVRRLIGPAGIVFKGSGFYSTDSRKTSSKANSSSEE